MPPNHHAQHATARFTCVLISLCCIVFPPKPGRLFPFKHVQRVHCTQYIPPVYLKESLLPYNPSALSRIDSASIEPF